MIAYAKLTHSPFEGNDRKVNLEGNDDYTSTLRRVSRPQLRTPSRYPLIDIDALAHLDPCDDSY